MGAAAGGVFLSAAIRCTSSAQWRPHRARSRGARAFDSSSPRPSAPSRRGQDGSERRTPGRSVWPLAAASRDRSCAQPGAALSPASGRVGVSGPETTPAVGQASAWAPAPVAPRADTLATSERPNSPRREPAEPPMIASVHPAGAARPTVGASPVARHFQEVACLIA